MKLAGLAATTLALGASSVAGLTDFVKNNVRTNMGQDRVVTINTEKITSNLEDLLEHHGADHFGGDVDQAHFRLTPDAYRALMSSSPDFKDTTESWINHFESNFADPNFFCNDDDCAKRDMQSFYSSYQSLDAIHSRVDSLATANPSLASITTAGNSYQGRDLKVILIGDQSKPLVFYFCNIHAREWLTPMFCTYMIETLLANGGHDILNTFSFAVLPSANPDGYVYSYTTNSMWRKTRKPNSGSSCVGTDGNRNYPVSHCGSGASTNPCSETYCGNAAFSEPETNNIAAFARAHAGRMIAMNDVHAYGQLWMCAWAYKTAPPPEADFSRMQQCNAAAAEGIRSVNGLVFQYGPISTTIYLAAGGAVDWFYDELDVVYSYSAEVRGSSFQPAASNIMPSNLEMFEGMLRSIQCIAEVENLSTGPPTPTSAPVPTAPPTSFPTAGCADLVPSGIQYSNGQPAPCDELGSYCAQYDFVRERCPVTCGTCQQVSSSSEAALMAAAASGELVVPAREFGGVRRIYVVAPIVAAAVAGVMVAALLVKRRQGREEAGEV